MACARLRPQASAGAPAADCRFGASRRCCRSRSRRPPGRGRSTGGAGVVSTGFVVASAGRIRSRDRGEFLMVRANKATEGPDRSARRHAGAIAALWHPTVVWRLCSRKSQLIRCLPFDRRVSVLGGLVAGKWDCSHHPGRLFSKEWFCFTGPTPRGGVDGPERPERLHPKAIKPMRPVWGRCGVYERYAGG
jgi:hypothetical protein